MKLILQIGIVFGVCLIGEGIATLLPIPMPGSVISMVLLLVLLLSGLLKVDHIAQKADFLLDNMAFFFIPAGVGIMEQFSVVQGYVWQILLICLITTVLTFAASAFTVRAVIALQNKVLTRLHRKED